MDHSLDTQILVVSEQDDPSLCRVRVEDPEVLTAIQNLIIVRLTDQLGNYLH